MVYGVLEDLVRAGVVHKRGGRGAAYYWMDRESMASSLGPGKRTPAFFVWGDVFHAFHAVITDRRARPEACGDELLAAERMRDLAAEVVPLLRGAGEPLSRLPYPGPGVLKGMEHAEALAAFLDEVLDILKRYALA